MDFLLINLLGISLITLTLWWFILSPRLSVKFQAGTTIDILVKDGIYEPSQIKIPVRTAFTLRFLREDPTPCSEVVVFPGPNHSHLLPLNKMVEIKFDPQPAGEIEFTCQMGMYRGRLIVA